ncbi:SDR family NAD(P)-dependent oxidoreductase [Christiangramia fulva]|uniref:SDR family oxidoreductase n=1 Tax=Christiangramia fulva TaxID=2126553 RepID=UPI001D054A19
MLVTAGASGIGKEIAKPFAEEIDKICICDINRDSLKDLSRETPGSVVLYCDIGACKSIEKMVAEAVKSMGGIDILIHNAGISRPTSMEFQ